MNLTFKSKTFLDAAGLTKAVAQASKTPLEQAGLLTSSAARKSVRKQPDTPMLSKKTGLPLKKKKSSKPGNPPFSITGKLKKNIVTRRGKDLLRPSVRVLSRKDRVHEFGGKNHPARPYLQPALEKQKAKFPGLWRGVDLAKTPAGKEMSRGNRRRFGSFSR